MNEMEKKLDQLLERLPSQQYDTDAWLIEDETAEFDRIVSQRRRKVWLWRWSAAAAVAVLLVVAGTMVDWKTEEVQQPVVHTTEQPSANQPAIEEQQQPLVAEAELPKTAPAPAQATTPKAIAQLAGRTMTPIDSLTDIVARIEQAMQGVRDSCYIANVEKLMRTDDRLQRLVNQLVLEGIMADTTTNTAFTNPQDND